jgi:hypothetical protein
MELAGSALTAALVGVIVVLSKLIEWFMKKNNESDVKMQKKESILSSHMLVKLEAKSDMLIDDVYEIKQTLAVISNKVSEIEGGQGHIVERIRDIMEDIRNLKEK